MIWSRDVPMSDYNAAPGIRGSEMRTFLDGGLGLVAHRRAFEMKETGPMRMGSMIHDLVEGQFLNRWVTTELKTRRGKAWEATEYAAAEDGYRLTTKADASLAEDAYYALTSHPEFRDRLASPGVLKEPSLFSDDCKLRPDVVLDRDLIHVKTVSTLAMFQGFQRTFQYQHRASAGFYQMVTEEAEQAAWRQFYAVVAVEPPFPTAFYHVGRDSIQFGMMEARAARDAIRVAVSSNEWNDAPINDEV